MHATVLVIGDDVDAAMEPFGQDSPAYMEFEEIDPENHKREYETGTMKAVLFPDGRSLFPRDAAKINSRIKFSSEKNEWVLPRGYKMIDMKLTELYDTLKEWMIEQNIEPYDETNDLFGYTSNPNAYWDWWEEGGRWKDCIPKKGKSTKGCTSCLKKEADFTKPTPKWMKHYSAVWEYVVNGIVTPGSDKNDLGYILMGKDDKARAKLIKEMKALGKEAFAKKESMFTPTAILRDGSWIETSTQEEFLNELANVDDDERITLVDYHM